MATDSGLSFNPYSYYDEVLPSLGMKALDEPNTKRKGPTSLPIYPTINPIVSKLTPSRSTSSRRHYLGSGRSRLFVGRKLRVI